MFHRLLTKLTGAVSWYGLGEIEQFVSTSRTYLFFNVNGNVCSFHMTIIVLHIHTSLYVLTLEETKSDLFM